MIDEHEGSKEGGMVDQNTAIQIANIAHLVGGAEAWTDMYLALTGDCLDEIINQFEALAHACD